MLKLQNLTKKFHEKNVLDGVNLEVKKGEIALLLGSSGVGKSTLLRVLCGLETIDRGTMTLDDVPLSRKTHSIGMVFQHMNLFSNMNVITNITFPLEKALGYSPRTAQLLALEFLHKYDLADKANLCITKLSGGQKQRLALIRTLALQPNVICFDEPTSALDPVLTTQVAVTLAQLAHEGYTVLVTTHDMSLVEKLPCTIYLMDKGAILQSAQSHAYWEHPEQFPHITRFIKGYERE
jgi:ABC-type polar amino acid transport system ATPase subunit